MMEKLRCLWLVLLMGSAFSFAQIARHNFTFEDAANLHSATAVAISPEGKTILYSVRFGGAKGPDTTEWRLIATTGGESRQLKLPDKFEPAGFTRDGSALYGTFEIDKRPQLVTFPLGPPNSAAAAAATPTPLTSMPRGIRSVVISPDGLHYALLADSRLPDPLEEVHSVVEAEQAGLYVVGETGLNGQWWCPTLNNIADIAWSHDGSSLAVLSHTPKIGFHYVRSFIDICTASGARHVATIDNAAGGIGWINGDVELIFLSTTSAVLTPDHVWTVSAAGGAPLDRTPKLEGSAEGLSVDVQGKAWIKVARGVRSEIDSFENHSLATAYGWPDGTIGGGPVSPQIASAPEIKIFTVDDPQHTANVAVARGNTLEKITYEGDDQLSNVAMGEVKAVRWTSKEGIPLEGIISFPAEFKRGQRYPFTVFPHGGPEARDSLRFDIFARYLAGIGYIVLQPEYRGSTGYGTAFLNAIYQHFGDRAYRDVDSATDFALAQGWADPNRLTIFGWSAGGFMSSWTVTQTHRYKAAVEGAGITDWLTFMWNSDLQQIDYDARWPDTDPNAFLQFSAAMHSQDVTTPLLIIHGLADQRVPAYQGRELFEALLDRGKTVRMVTYPGSGHFPRLWEQRQDLAREIAAWFAKYNPEK